MLNKKFIKLYKKFQKKTFDYEIYFEESIKPTDALKIKRPHLNDRPPSPLAVIYLFQAVNPLGSAENTGQKLANFNTEPFDVSTKGYSTTLNTPGQFRLELQSKRLAPKSIFRLFSTPKLHLAGSHIEIYCYALSRNQAQIKHLQTLILSKIELTHLICLGLKLNLLQSKHTTEANRELMLLGAFISSNISCDGLFVNASELEQGLRLDDYRSLMQSLFFNQKRSFAPMLQIKRPLLGLCLSIQNLYTRLITKH